jgi:hypothetical protein
MTVAAESDFQSRPVIFRTNQASVLRQLSVRGRHRNREHRRANVYIPKTGGIGILPIDRLEADATNLRDSKAAG